MRVTSFPQIRNYRIFRDFKWPAGLTSFARYNLIFAGNGTGKTTLSHLFRQLGHKQSIPSSEGDVHFSIDGAQVRGSDLNRQQLPEVRVFNRDSVARTVFEETAGEFPPVFYLGEVSVEKQKEIAKLRKSAEDLSSNHEKAVFELERARDSFETFCTTTARAIKNLLTASGSSYNTYDKAAFKKTAIKMLEGTLSKVPFEKPLRQDLLLRKSGTPKMYVSLLPSAEPNYKSLRDDVAEVLAVTVISELLSELQANPIVSAWVAEGLPLHTTVPSCHFCAQPLPSERITRLEAHFNDQFKAFQLRVDILNERLETAKRSTEISFAPSAAELFEDLAEGYKSNLDELLNVRKKGKQYLEVLQSILRTKKAKPFESLAFGDTWSSILKESLADGRFSLLGSAIDKKEMLADLSGRNLLDDLNSTLGGHNIRVDNHSSELARVRRELERHEVAIALPNYVEKLAFIAELETTNKANQSAARGIQEQISQLAFTMSQHQQPAEELTREMTAYLGNNELNFEVRDTGYVIRRGTQPALHLSEGERTAVAFLYFLKSLGDSAFDLRTGIVVIDDPVSSLDAGALYCAFGYLKARTSEANQLFIFTHNLTFFRLVKNWFSHLKDQKKADLARRPAAFYMLISNVDRAGRSAQICALDPLLHEYESEYHFLFKCVLDAASMPAGEIELAACYGIANIARRMTETFLAFRLPQTSGDLQKKLDMVYFDVAKKTRILRFLDIHSHGDAIGEPEHDPSVFFETTAILKDLLDLIKENDPDHYQGLCERLASVQSTKEEVLPALG
jgi:wobble nucleotide-excising tRNase